MPRAFLMCVGTRDPYWAKKDGRNIPYMELTLSDEPYKIKGPILTFFENFLPPPGKEDRIQLFSTPRGPKVRDPTEKCGEATKQELEKLFQAVVEHWRFPTDIDPSEFVDVHRAMENLVDWVAKGLPSDYETIVFVQPGTPQMQAAWMVLAHAGRIRAKLFRVFFENDKPQVVLVELGPLMINSFLSVGLEAFKRQDFTEAASLFAELAQRLSRAAQRMAQFCAEVAKVYSAWFALDYQTAFESLKELKEDYTDLLRYSELDNILKEAEQALQMRVQTKEKEHLKLRAADLYHTAYRRCQQGENAEALWRAATVVEMFEVQRAKDCGFKGLLRGEAHTYLLEKKKDHALSSIKHENQLFKKRSDSIHRGKPVSKEDANNALELAKEAILRYFPALDLNDHLLCISSIQNLVSHLARLLT